MNTRDILSALGISALMLLASGCAVTPADGGGGTSGPGSVEAASSPDPQALAKADEFLVGNGPAEQARQIVLRDCMDKAGFVWPDVTPRQMKVEDLIPLKPLSLEQARSVGYATSEQVNAPESQFDQSPAATEALNGPPGASRVSVEVLGMRPSVSSEGCLGESYKRVYGSIENGMMATGVTANAVLPAVNAAIGDDSVIDANKHWSECMAKANFPNLETPDRAWDNARQNPQDAASIAVTDAKCRESVSYEGVRNAALNKYLTTFLTRNEALITEIQGIRKKGALEAQAILSGV